MVAIFSGAGAGLERGSGSVLGKAGLLGSSSLGRGGEQLFVNAATGNLVINREDEFLVGRGPDVAIARTYNSLAEVGDDNNDNWRQSTDRRVFGLAGTLNSTGSSVKRVSGDGSVITYSWNGTAYRATDGAGAYDQLVHSGGVWTWTDGDSQITETYQAYGSEWRITAQSDTSGNALSFTYTGAKLTRITTANGEYIDYTWSGSELASIVTNAGGTLTRTRYTYDGHSRLSTVKVDLSPTDNSITDGNVYTTTYTYHGSSKLVASISQTDGSRVDITYDSSERVSTYTQTVASGVTRVTTFTYGADYTNITDPAGQVTRLDFALGNTATGIGTWNTSNVSEQATTIGGAAATKYTIVTNGWAAATQETTVAAGDTVTWGLTIQAAGSLTSYDLGLYGDGGANWGLNGQSCARIVSGPGQLVQVDGGLWRLTGLSASQGTRVEITRTYTQGQTAKGYLYPDATNGLAGSAVIVADAALLKSATATTLSSMDLANWDLIGASWLSAGTIDGSPAYLYKVLNSGGIIAATYTTFVAEADETYSLSMSLKAVGSATSQYIALEGTTTGLGANDDSIARIVSGPGTIAQVAGGQFLVSGLSSTVATRIEITRRYTQGETGRAFLSIDAAYGYRYGLRLIASAPHLVKHITEPASEPRLIKITAPAPHSGGAAQVVQFAYNMTGDLTSVTDALNQTASYTYDANGNLLTSTDRLGNVVTRTYGSNNELLTETRVGSDSGGAANSHTTRYAYDGLNRRVYSVSAEGHVTRYWYDANGQNYWTNDFPDAVAPSTAVTASQLDDWCLSLGNTTSSQISYTTFDARGNADGTRGYNVPDGFAWLNTAQDYSYQNFVYDPSGRLLSRQRNGESPETFVYDGLGRLIASTDLNGGTTNFYYNDASQQSVVTLANGLVRTSTYNKAGELIASAESGDFVTGGTATYQYDRNGRLRVQTDATGNNSYFLFDKVGRKVGDVGADGSLIEYRYDSGDRLVARIRYATQLTSGQLSQIANTGADVDMSSIRPALTGSEEWVWTVYDGEGRVIQAIEGEGSVTAYDYDASGQLVRTTAFVNSLSASQVDAFKATPPASVVLPAAHANDAVTRTFYDKDGRLIGSLDGLGYLGRTTYDKAGRKVIEEAFFTPASAGLRGSGTFDQLLASAGTHASDRRTRYVYDGQGQLRFAIDGLNQVTGYGYEATTAGESHGLVRTTTLYAGTIATLGTYSYTAVKNAIASAGLTSHGDNRISYNVYDAAGRIAYAIDAAGAMTGYAYDQQGQVTKIVQYGTLTGFASLPSKSGADGWAASNAHSSDRTTRYFYSDRELKYTIDAAGYVTRFDYDAEGRKTGEVRWDTAVSANDSWTANTVAVTVGGANVQTSTTYDGLGRVLLEYDALGTPTYYWYRGNGQLGWKAVGYGTADQVDTVYYYNEAGQLEQRVDASGTAEQRQETYTYDAFGNVTQVADWMSATTRTYDQLGRLLTETRGGSTTSYEYNAFGEVVKTTDPNSNASYTYYDRLGRAVTSRDAESYLTETSYNLFGEVASVTRRYQRTIASPSTSVIPTAAAHAKDATTSFEYDKLGQVTKTIDAEGFFERYWYDAFGHRIQVQNKIGGYTGYQYTATGRLFYEYVYAPVHDQTGNAVATSYYKNIYYYDGRGNLTQRTEGWGHPERRDTVYTYDNANRLTRIDHPLVTVLSQSDHSSTSSVSPFERFVYDRRGNVIEHVDQLGARTLAYYDDLDRKTVEIDALGTYTDFGYDGVDNLVSRRVYGTQIALPATAGGVPPAPPGGTDYRHTAYTYDALNRLTATSVANVRTGAWNGSIYATGTDPVTTHIDYDANGNVIKTTDANGNAAHSYYDKLGRKIAEVDQENYLTSWTHDAEGNALLEQRYATKLVGAPSLYTFPGPVAHGDDRITQFIYDKNGRRLSETRDGVSAHYVSSGGALGTAATSSTVSYLYNGLGQVVYKSEAVGESTDYAYDDSGRLISESRAGYYDDSGAFVRPTVNYYYNVHGDLVRTRQGRATAAGGDRITTYTYDAGGRMTAMTDAAGVTRNYYHDAAGNLLRESYDRIRSDGGTVTDRIVYTRDVLGRVTLQRAQSYSGGGWTGEGQSLAYNAYGELSHRGLNGLWQEQFHYDGLGRLAASNEGDGVWRFHLHDGVGNRTLTIESEGTDLSGSTTQQVLTLATVNGSIGGGYIDGINVTISLFDKRGLAVENRQPERQLDAGNRAAITTSRGYNAFGEVAYETDARGYRTDYKYNTMGRLTEKKGPEVAWTSSGGVAAYARPTETYHYDLSGRLVATIDANSNHDPNDAIDFRTTRLLLAGSGFGGTEALVTAEFHADGGVARTFYDAFGDARLLRNELSTSAVPTYNSATDETRSYDAMGRLVSVTHRGGLLTDNYTYDLLGNRLRHWNSQLGSGNFEATDYDAQGRIVSQQAFGGDVVTTSYAWSNSIATSGMGTYGGWTQTTTHVGKSRDSVETTDRFGRLVAKSDLGDNAFTYSYDLAGRQTAQSGGETLTYSWLNTGRIGRIDGASGNYTSYSYDANGNKDAEYTVRASVAVQDATATYDALNRLVTWTEATTSVTPAASLTYQYDLNGNVRATEATYSTIAANGAATAAPAKHEWYLYDSMNRVTLARADRNPTTGALTGGTAYTYNAAGQRKTASSYVTGMTQKLWAWRYNQQSQWAFYNAPQEFYGGETDANYLWTFSGTRLETYAYNHDGTLASVSETRTLISGNGTAGGGVTVTAGGQTLLRGSFSYDAMGRQTGQTDYSVDYGSDPIVTFDRDIVYNAKGQIESETAYTLQNGTTGQLWRNTVTHTYGSGSGDPLGAVVQTTSVDAKYNGYTLAFDDQFSTVTTNSHAWHDGAVLSGMSVVKTPLYSGGGSPVSSSTSYTLDTLGRTTAATIIDSRSRTVSYVTDLAGQVLRRTENDNISGNGDPHEHFYRFDGREMGRTGNDGGAFDNYTASIADRATVRATGDGPFRHGATNHSAYARFAPNLEGITTYNQGAGGGAYTVQAGDTLRGIAAMVWGDADLWYKIAEANGLSGDAALAEGRTLTLPAGVVKSGHSANTFKPYDAADALGETNPISPNPTGRAKNKCGAFGAILLTVVAVAVTVVTSGAALAALGPAGTSLGTGIATVLGTSGGLAVGGAATVAAGGVATGTFALAGAIGGAVGSIASQGFGVATGLQDKFSWKGVALAGLSGGFNGALGGVNAFGAAGTAARLGSAAARGAAASLLTQGIGVVTGLQSKFDFAGVAAAGLGSAASAGILPKVQGLGRFGASLAANTAGGIANGAARSLINGESFGDNLIRALPEVVGSTVGNALAAAMAGARGAANAGLAAVEGDGAGGANDIVVTGGVSASLARTFSLEGLLSAQALGATARAEVDRLHAGFATLAESDRAQLWEALTGGVWGAAASSSGADVPIAGAGNIPPSAYTSGGVAAVAHINAIVLNGGVANLPEYLGNMRAGVSDDAAFLSQFRSGTDFQLAFALRAMQANAQDGRSMQIAATIEAEQVLRNLRYGDAADAVFNQSLSDVGRIWLQTASVAAGGFGLIAGSMDTGIAMYNGEFSEMDAGTAAMSLITRRRIGGNQTAVIGRMEDLDVPGAIRPGEYTIASRLPNLGNPRDNYRQNMSVLRGEMRRGLPIRDASAHRPDSQPAPTPLNPDRTIRQTFTGAERNQLRNRGWTFDGQYWNPPIGR